MRSPSRCSLVIWPDEHGQRRRRAAVGRAWQASCTSTGCGESSQVVHRLRWFLVGACVGALVVSAASAPTPFRRWIDAGVASAGRSSLSPRSAPSPGAIPSPVPTARLPPDGRVIVDSVVWVTPPQTGATCLVLPPGELTAVVQLVGDHSDAIVTFSFAGDESRDPAASIRIDVSASSAGWTVPLDGGRYCYLLNNWGPVTDNPRGTPVRELGRDVALQLAWSPCRRTR